MDRVLTDDRVFRKASMADVEEIWTILLQAKAQMKAAGSCQWNELYPSLDDVRGDIARMEGYVAVDAVSGTLLAYGVVSFEGEPVYDQIAESWAADGPYVVVHRLAVADGCKHQGVAGWFMREAEQLAMAQGVFAFRVDTKYDNRFMLRLIDRLGFRYVGEVEYRGGEWRRAYEKCLSEIVAAD